MHACGLYGSLQIGLQPGLLGRNRGPNDPYTGDSAIRENGDLYVRNRTCGLDLLPLEEVPLVGLELGSGQQHRPLKGGRVGVGIDLGSG